MREDSGNRQLVKGVAMTSASETPVDLPTPAPRALEVEQNGINSISVSEHRGRPREAVLAVVRRQHFGTRDQLRRLPPRLRHLFRPGGRRRGGRHRRFVPALRPGFPVRQARPRANDDVEPRRLWGQRQPGPLCHFLAASGRLGDRPCGPCGAGHCNRLPGWDGRVASSTRSSRSSWWPRSS